MRKFSVHTLEIGLPMTKEKNKRFRIHMKKRGLKREFKSKNNMWYNVGFEEKGIRLYTRKLSKEEGYNYHGSSHMLCIILSLGHMLGHSIEELPYLDIDKIETVKKIFKEEIRKFIGNECIPTDIDSKNYELRRIDVTADIIVPEKKDIISIIEIIRKTPLKKGFEHNYLIERATDSFVPERSINITTTAHSGKYIEMILYDKKEQLKEIGHDEESERLNELLRIEVKLKRQKIRQYVDNTMCNSEKIFAIYKQAEKILITNMGDVFYKTSCMNLASLNMENAKKIIDESDISGFV